MKSTGGGCYVRASRRDETVLLAYERDRTSRRSRRCCSPRHRILKAHTGSRAQLARRNAARGVSDVLLPLLTASRVAGSRKTGAAPPPCSCVVRSRDEVRRRGRGGGSVLPAGRRGGDAVASTRTDGSDRCASRPGAGISTSEQDRRNVAELERQLKELEPRTALPSPSARATEGELGERERPTSRRPIR